MKVASLLIAVAALALSSCVAKPWMVGSVNDQYGPPKLERSKLLSSSSEYSVSHDDGALINPVGRTGIHPPDK